MRVFLAGASGVLGMRLVPLLLKDGHPVAGMTRSPQKVETLRSLGVEPVLCDVYDADVLCAAVQRFQPDVIIDQLTDLPDDASLIPGAVFRNNRMRREGTANLLGAARASGVNRVIAQSVAWSLPGESGAATRDLERAVLEFGGVVIRYGQLYGPGTYYTTELPPPPRVHADVAALRTMATLGEPSGTIVTITEGEP